MSKYVINNPDNQFIDALGNTFKIGDDVLFSPYNNYISKYNVEKECKHTLSLRRKDCSWRCLIRKTLISRRIVKINK